MSMESDAKEIAILRMMDFFQSSSRLTEGQLSAYFEAAEGVSLEAVQRSCKQFQAGKVEGRNNAFIPNAVEFAQNARQWDEAIAQVTADRKIAEAQKLVHYPIGTEPPPPLEALGPIKVDFGRGTIDMSDMTGAEKEAVLANKGLPDGLPAIGKLRKMGDA